MVARNHWNKVLTATAGTNSTPLLLPRRIGEVSVAAVPSGGATCTVQYTLDDPEAVVANPAAATWMDWEPGPVATAVARALAGPITAVRITSSGGTSSLRVVGWFDY